VIDGLVARETDLGAALTSMSNLADSKMTAMRQIDTDTAGRRSSPRLARIAACEPGRYPLEATVKAVQELLDAQKVVEPMLADARKISREISIATRWPFRSSTRPTTSSPRVRNAQRSIRRSTTWSAPRRTSTGRRAASTRCARTRRRTSSRLTGLGKSNAQLVAESVSSVLGALFTICRDATRPAVQCDKLANLAALQPADFSTMDDEHLRFAEYGLG